MTWLYRALLIATMGTACAHTITRSQVKTVDQLYALGVEELEGGLYPEALKDLNELKTKYPYSRFAALAELRIADAHYRRAKYFEAIDAYRNFLKFHPTHDQADYAMFQIAESFFEQLPNDFIMLPPSAEKDQVNTHMAISAFTDMLNRFPTGPSSDRAREHLSACRRRLADHEMYVARFYLRDQHWAAAAGRAEGLLEQYAGLGLDADALWICGKARAALHDWSAAKPCLLRLTDEFANSPHAPGARVLLKDMPSDDNSSQNYRLKAPNG